MVIGMLSCNQALVLTPKGVKVVDVSALWNAKELGDDPPDDDDGSFYHPTLCAA